MVEHLHWQLVSRFKIIRRGDYFDAFIFGREDKGYSFLGGFYQIG